MSVKIGKWYKLWKVLFMSIIKIIRYLFIFYVYYIHSINLIDNDFPVSSLQLDSKELRQLDKIKKAVIKINYTKKNNREIHSVYGFYSSDQILVDSQSLPAFTFIDNLWFTNDNKKYELFATRILGLKYETKLLNIFFNSSQTESPFTEYLYSGRTGNSWPLFMISNLDAENNPKALELLTIFTPLIEYNYKLQYVPQIGPFIYDRIFIVDIGNNSYKKYKKTSFSLLIVGHIQSSTSTEEVHEISFTTLANITSNGKLYYFNKSNKKTTVFGIAKIGVLSNLDLGSSVIICVERCRLGGFISKIINIKIDKDIARDYGINVTGNDGKENATIFSFNTIVNTNITENSKIQGGISFAYNITDLNTGEKKSLDLIPRESIPITSSRNNKKPNAILGMQQYSNKSIETPTHDITPRLVLPNETQPSTSLNSLGIRHVQPTNQLSESSESTNQQGIKRPRTDDKTTINQQGIKRPRTDDKTTINQQGIKRPRTDDKTTTNQQGIKRPRTDDRQPFAQSKLHGDNPPSPDYFSDSDRGPLNVINESKNKYHRVNLKDLVNDCYSRIIIRTFDDVQHKQLVEESSELKEYPPESSINDENIDTFLNGLPRKYDYKNTIDPEKIVAPENESKKIIIAKYGIRLSDKLLNGKFKVFILNKGDEFSLDTLLLDTNSQHIYTFNCTRNSKKPHIEGIKYEPNPVLIEKSREDSDELTGDDNYFHSSLNSDQIIAEQNLPDGVYVTSDLKYFQVFEHKLYNLELKNSDYDISIYKQDTELSKSFLMRIFKNYIPNRLWFEKKITTGNNFYYHYTYDSNSIQHEKLADGVYVTSDKHYFQVIDHKFYKLELKNPLQDMSIYKDKQLISNLILKQLFIQYNPNRLGWNEEVIIGNNIYFHAKFNYDQISDQKKLTNGVYVTKDMQYFQVIAGHYKNLELINPFQDMSIYKDQDLIPNSTFIELFKYYIPDYQELRSWLVAEDYKNLPQNKVKYNDFNFVVTALSLNERNAILKRLNLNPGLYMSNDLNYKGDKPDPLYIEIKKNGTISFENKPKHGSKYMRLNTRLKTKDLTQAEIINILKDEDEKENFAENILYKSTDNIYFQVVEGVIITLQPKANLKIPDFKNNEQIPEDIILSNFNRYTPTNEVDFFNRAEALEKITNKINYINVWKYEQQGNNTVFTLESIKKPNIQENKITFSSYDHQQQQITEKQQFIEDNFEWLTNKFIELIRDYRKQ